MTQHALTPDEIREILQNYDLDDESAQALDHYISTVQDFAETHDVTPLFVCGFVHTLKTKSDTGRKAEANKIKQEVGREGILRDETEQSRIRLDPTTVDPEYLQDKTDKITLYGRFAVDNDEPTHDLEKDLESHKLELINTSETSDATILELKGHIEPNPFEKTGFLSRFLG